jgi:hypothetical protein
MTWIWPFLTRRTFAVTRVTDLHQALLAVSSVASLVFFALRMRAVWGRWVQDQARDEVILGPATEVGGRPGFLGQIGQTPALIQLDSGALFKLLDYFEPDELPYVLIPHRERVQRAAQYILEHGFAIEQGTGLAILVTALELDDLDETADIPADRTSWDNSNQFAER